MMSLKQPLDNEIEIEGNRYELNLSYDNVLRWFDLLEDETVNELGKIEIGFMMFVIDCPNVDIEVKMTTVQEIGKYISGSSEDEQEDGGVYEPQPQYYCFDQDADYIISAFYQQYGIDLDEQKGKLRWEKFIALMNGLTDATKFSEIMGYRAAVIPSGNDPSEVAERERLLKLKQIYELKSDKNVAFMEAQMSSIFDSLVESVNEKGGTVNE